jgi:hypothetical protein
MQLPEDIAKALAPASKTELWTAVMKLIDTSIYTESVQAVGKEQKGEDRAWHCGRVDALMALKDLLVDTQEQAARQLGYVSSENGTIIK